MASLQFFEGHSAHQLSPNGRPNSPCLEANALVYSILLIATCIGRLEPIPFKSLFQNSHHGHLKKSLSVLA